MARNRTQNREARRQIRSKGREQKDAALLAAASPDIRHVKPRRVHVMPKTFGQELYDRSIEMNTITFAIGPWGTGKTWFIAARAAQAFIAGDIERIVITRPAVEADEELGFLPGGLEEKWAPWFKPVRDALAEILGSGPLEYALKDGRIEMAPLGFLRGNTFKNAWVIADEMQNSTPRQMKMLLSRIGEGTKMFINGDTLQKDITGLSGLEDAIARVHGSVSSVGLVEFGVDDIVRSGIAREIFLAYHGA